MQGDRRPGPRAPVAGAGHPNGGIFGADSGMHAEVRHLHQGDWPEGAADRVESRAGDLHRHERRAGGSRGLRRSQRYPVDPHTVTLATHGNPPPLGAGKQRGPELAPVPLAAAEESGLERVGNGGDEHLERIHVDEREAEGAGPVPLHQRAAGGIVDGRGIARGGHRRDRVAGEPLPEDIAEGSAGHHGVPSARCQLRMEHPFVADVGGVRQRELQGRPQRDAAEYLRTAHGCAEAERHGAGRTECSAPAAAGTDQPERTVGGERPAPQLGDPPLVVRPGHHQVPLAPERQRRARRQPHHASQRVRTPVAVPPSGFAELPTVIRHNRSLLLDPKPHDAGRPAQPVQLDVGRAVDHGRVHRDVHDQLEPAFRSEIAAGQRRPDGRSGEHARAPDTKRMDERLGQAAAVHRLEAVRDRDGERAVRRQRRGRPEPQRDRVPPVHHTGEAGLDAEEGARIHRAVERARDRPVERDGDGGGGGRLLAGDDPQDSQLRRRTGHQHEARGRRESERPVRGRHEQRYRGDVNRRFPISMLV